MTLQELITHYLRSRQLQGRMRLAVDEEARAVLRGWMLAARSGRRAEAAPSRSNIPAGAASGAGITVSGGAAFGDSPAETAAASGSTPSPLTGHTLAGGAGAPNAPGAPLASGDAAGANPAPARSGPPGPGAVAREGGAPGTHAAPGAPAPGSLMEVAMQEPVREPELTEEEIPFFRPGGSTPEETWELMQRLLPVWKPLLELNSLRRTPVFGMGNRNADIMFVGDAPGYNDELRGEPFRGEAGEKLDAMLRAMNLSRESIYITHLVKFRPAMPRQTTNTRPPTVKEVLFSRSVLDLEVRLVQPRVIVALGVIAARGLLQRGELPLAAYQAQPGDYDGIPVIVTHHPSYLLRTSNLAERRRLWEEMLRVLQIAGLPITEKQQRYFLPKQQS